MTRKQILRHWSPDYPAPDLGTLGRRDDATLVGEIANLSEQFGKQKQDDGIIKRLSREDLELICFEFVST